MPGRPKVYSVAIEVTARCQQKCDYCYNAWREDNGAGMEAGSAKKLRARVEKLLASLDLDHVTITGGEPFARRDIFELLDLVKASGVGIQIISNDGLVDDTLAQRLAPYGVSRASAPPGYAARHAAELLPSRDDLLVAFCQAVPFAKDANHAGA